MKKQDEKMIRRGESCRAVPSVLLFLISFLITVLLCGCNETTPVSSDANVTSSYIEVDDFRVPVFATPEEQLNYTRTWFAKIQEKRAALKTFIQLHPQEKRLCGLAALDLAYLQLGSDYRFAYKYASFAAIKDYMAILEMYTDFPEIMVKAHWYIGWIYSDLLKDRGKGVAEYQKIVRRYPRETVTLLPPSPWVSIIYQSDLNVNTSLLNRPVNCWAALALVEIIRYAELEEVAWGAFVELWGNYRNNVAAGFGLRVILQKRYHTGESLKMAREYMEKEFSNVHILGDIQKEINAISDAEGGTDR